MKLSKKFVHAIKLNNLRHYEICQKASPPLHPSVLSKLINGIEKVRDNDERVLSVGRVLGIPADECFEKGDVK